MLAGATLTGFHGEILVISVSNDTVRLRGAVADLATETMQVLGRPHRYQVEDVHINADYLGKGYGVVTQGEREAITSFAQNEGLLLDPVYAGRAAAGRGGPHWPDSTQGHTAR